MNVTGSTVLVTAVDMEGWAIAAIRMDLHPAVVEFPVTIPSTTNAGTNIVHMEEDMAGWAIAAMGMADLHPV